MTARDLGSGAAVRTRLVELASRVSTPLTVPDDFRRAAVLALVGCERDVPRLVLTERSSRLRAHAGEIALPGGRIDPGETPEVAAIREAVEEVGVAPERVEVLGRLDEAWSKAHNHVVPVVAWYDGPLDALAPASPEVVQVFLTPLTAIAHPDAHRFDIAEIGGVTYENDVVDTPDCRIYGLTADLVLDLVAWLTGRERDRVPPASRTSPGPSTAAEHANRLAAPSTADRLANMTDPRRTVRAGYDAISGRYLAERPTDSADVALLDDLISRLAPRSRVLDAGCGAGVPVTQRVLDADLITTALDFSAAQLGLARDLVPGAGLVQGDLTVLPFPDQRFDAVVSFYAVIHVPRDDHPAVLDEMRRVLRPGGWALLCLGAGDNPGDHDEDSWLGAPMYWSHFDADTNRRLVRDAGLDIVDDPIVPDPMDHGGHLFVLARRPLEQRRQLLNRNSTSVAEQVLDLLGERAVRAQARGPRRGSAPPTLARTQHVLDVARQAAELQVAEAGLPLAEAPGPSPRISRSRSASRNPSVDSAIASMRASPSGVDGSANRKHHDSAAAAPDPAPQLVQLREPEPVGVLHDHHRRVRHVDADLDHGRRDEHVGVAGAERGHRRLLLRRLHLPVQQPEPQPGRARSAGERARASSVAALASIFGEPSTSGHTTNACRPAATSLAQPVVRPRPVQRARADDHGA